MDRRRRLGSGLGRALAVAFVAFGAIFGALVWSSAAGAHSVLESSSPASGETVPDVPERITLQFNEPVLIADGAVRLLDVEGDDVDISTARAVDAAVTVELPSDLADGSYVVAWRVMSADSHPVSGAFTFAIGAPSVASDGSDPLAAARADEATAPGAQVAVDVSSALAYAGALLAVGAAIFVVFVASEGGAAATGRLVRVGAAIGALGLVGGTVSAAALIDGGFPSGSTLGDQLFGSAGLQALVGLSGLALVLVAASRPLPTLVQRIMVIDGTLGALAAFVIVGHTRTASPVALTMVVDVVHLTAAAVWTGGLVALLVTLRRVPADGEQPVDRATVVARFSQVATAAILVVAVAGLVLGWQIVGSWGALTGTAYGVLLLVKVGLFAVLAAVGAFNKFRLVDRVAGEEPLAAGALLRRTLGLEILLVVAIIGVTGSFTSISPEEAPDIPETTPITCSEAQAMEGMPGMETMDHESCVGTTTTGVPFDPTAGAGASGGAVVDSDAFGDGLAYVTVSPARVGVNTVTIGLTDADGASIDTEEPPTVEFRLREKQLGPISVTAERVGPGAYRLTQDLVLPGAWEVNVSGVVSDFEQPQAIVVINVAG